MTFNSVLSKMTYFLANKQHNFRRNNLELVQNIIKVATLHAFTFSYSPQNKNARLFNNPVRVEEQAL